jgi:hypothetical protein
VGELVQVGVGCAGKSELLAGKINLLFYLSVGSHCSFRACICEFKEKEPWKRIVASQVARVEKGLTLFPVSIFRSRFLPAFSSNISGINNPEVSNKVRSEKYV